MGFWDTLWPYVSEKAPHLDQQIDPGDFQHWNNRSGTVWSASEVLTSRSAACPSGSRWSSSRWWWRHFLHQGLVRMAKGSNLDLGFFSPKSPSHGPKIIQQDQRTHSELVHQSGLRRSCAGLHRLELCFHAWLWLKPEVLNDGRRENNMDFF